MNRIELHSAIENSNIETIERLLDQGADIDAIDDNGITALHIASMNNKSNIVQILISHGASIDPKTNESYERACYTPLHYAVERGHEEIVKILLSNNANVNLHTMLAMVPRNVTVLRQNVAIARDLLSHGVSVDCLYSVMYPLSYYGLYASIPQHFADENGHGELVKLLSDGGADINFDHIGKSTPLHIAVRKGYIGIVKALLEHGANVDPEDDLLQTPLCIAMQRGCMAIQLLEYGLDIDFKYRKLQTEYEIITKLLLEHGATFDSGNKIFQMGLHAAAKMGSTTIVECILKSFPDIIVSCRNPLENNCTLLHAAAESWNVKSIEFLIRHGANVNAEDQRGLTPIFYVVKEDYESPLHPKKNPADALKIAELLLSNGANADIGAKNEKTPLHVSVENCHYDMVQLLLMHNACVESHVENGISPLHVAADKGHVQIAEALLNHGARIDSACVQGSMSSSSDLDWPRIRSPGYCSSFSYVPTYTSDQAPVVINSLSIRYSTPLDCAAKKGHEELVKLLLSKDADANAKSANDSTPLCSAINGGHDRIVKLLLDHGFHVDVNDKELKAALFSAVSLGYVATIEHILKSRSEVNVVDGDVGEHEGRTLLHQAVQCGKTQVAELLIKHGTDLNSVDKDGKTLLLYALHLAIMRCQFFGTYEYKRGLRSVGFNETVKCLCEHGARVDPTAENLKTMVRHAIEEGLYTLIEPVLKYCSDVKMLLHTNGSPVLHTAIEKNYAKVAKVLLKYGASVNTTNERGQTALHLAASADREVVEMLIEYGADVDRRDKDGKTALHIAASIGSLQVMTVLLKYGADVNITSNDNFTSLDYAIEKNYAKVAKVLLKYGASVNTTNERGKTALHLAAGADREVVEMLIEYGADVDRRDKDGKTALHIAASIGSLQVMTVLLKYGADVNITSNDNFTSLDYAIEKNYAKVAKVLLKYGASVNTTNESGKTALHLAAGADREVVEMLIEYGADVDRRDKDGKTALHIAASIGSLQVMTVLLKYGADVNITSNDNFTSLDYASKRSNLQGDDKPHEQILIKHLIKMKAANLFVSQENLQSIELSASYGCLYDTCKAECEMMRNTKVADTRFSFYDILTGFHYARNESVVRTLESLDYEAIFPVYSDRIKNNFKRAQRRIYLLNDGATFLNSSLGYELPADVTMEIFGYLSNFDLQHLIEAYTNDDSEKLNEIIERNKRKNNVIIKGFRVKTGMTRRGR